MRDVCTDRAAFLLRKVLFVGNVKETPLVLNFLFDYTHYFGMDVEVIRQCPVVGQSFRVPHVEEGGVQLPGAGSKNAHGLEEEFQEPFGAAKHILGNFL